MVIAVVGGNWGDEGKGKLTDMLAEKTDMVIRFQGGANAGHTIINDYGKFALHMLPSGVFSTKVTNVIATGVAVNLDKIFDELDTIIKRGVPTPNLLVSERAEIVMPYHILFDVWEEERLGKDSFGSTKAGIAPFYSDKYMKLGIQVADIFSDGLMERLKKVCDIKNKQIDALYLGKDKIVVQEMYNYLMGFKDRLENMVANTAVLINDALKNEMNILLEGQLGTLRDPDNGIYPMTTSSSPLAGFASVGAGIPPYLIKKIVVVTKAYSTCVGAGPFVSEIFGEEADTLRKRGGDNGEFGATTGRPRRMGWFDVVATRYGCMMQGATNVALTCLDVLSYMDKIPVCIAYKIDGKTINDFPVTNLLYKAEPVIEYLDGWKCDIRDVKDFDDLPINAKKYVEFIEKAIGYPITYVSNGPKRSDMLYR